MDLVRKIKNLLNYRTPGDEIARLTGERDELVQRERTAYTYIRRKINHLLKIMGTLPLRPEELDDRTLLELDPIGIIADSFTQVLEHLNTTNDKLRLAQEELQAVLATAGVGIVVVDDAMRTQTYNLKAKELFFRDGGLPAGGTCHELLCGSALPPKECTFEKVKTSRIGVHLKDWVFRDRHFDVAGTPIKNRYGDVTHVVLVYNDVTDRKRTEDALRATEAMYRGIFDSASELIQSLAPDGSLCYVNRVWCETLGYSSHEARGISLADLIHPDHLHACLRAFEEALTGMKHADFRTVFIDRQGRPVPLQGTISSSSADGKPVAVCCILRPVTPLP